MGKDNQRSHNRVRVSTGPFDSTFLHHNNGVEGTVTCYSYSVYTVTGYNVTVTCYSSLPLKNCLTMDISVVAPLR
jgi:hypothetical protein